MASTSCSHSNTDTTPEGSLVCVDCGAVVDDTVEYHPPGAFPTSNGVYYCVKGTFVPHFNKLPTKGQLRNRRYKDCVSNMRTLTSPLTPVEREKAYNLLQTVFFHPRVIKLKAEKKEMVGAACVYLSLGDPNSPSGAKIPSKKMFYVTCNLGRRFCMFVRMCRLVEECGGCTKVTSTFTLEETLAKLAQDAALSLETSSLALALLRNLRLVDSEGVLETSDKHNVSALLLYLATLNIRSHSVPAPTREIRLKEFVRHLNSQSALEIPLSMLYKLSSRVARLLSRFSTLPAERLVLREKDLIALAVGNIASVSLPFRTSTTESNEVKEEDVKVFQGALAKWYEESVEMMKEKPYVLDSNDDNDPDLSESEMDDYLIVKK